MNENPIQQADTIQQTKIAQKPSKEKIIYTTMEKVFALVYIMLGYYFIRFVCYGTLSLTAGIFFSAAAIISFVFMLVTKQKITIINFICLILILASSCIFVLISSEFIKAMNFIFLTIGFSFWIRTIGNGLSFVKKGLFFDFIEAGFMTPFVFFNSCFASIFQFKRKKTDNKNSFYIFLGLVLSIPILLIVVPLLISSDAAFYEFLYLGFFYANITSFFWQIIFGFLIASMLYSVVICRLHKRDERLITREKRDSVSENSKIIPPVVVVSAVVPAIAVYVLYFFSQLAYFIDAFGRLIPEGYSVSDYARRGFFELCTIAVVNMGIIWFALVLSKRIKGKINKGVKVVSIIISAFTLVLITTALRKMILYIDIFGLTRLRVFTSVFMIFLALVFVFIIIKILLHRFNIQLAMIISFLAIFLTLCFSNVDANIARYNVELYQNGKIDFMGIQMVNEMDESSVHYLLPLLMDEEFTEKEELKMVLQAKYNDIYDNCQNDFNYQSYKAAVALEEAGFKYDTSEVLYSYNYFGNNVY